MSSKLYLAYGSNLHKAQMQQRCPTAKPLGKLLLRDCRLVFRGVADVEYHAGASAAVGLWRIWPADERALDRYEGVTGGLYSKEYLPVNGEPALIYLMNQGGIYPPSSYYANVIRTGYENFGLDQRYLNEAITHSLDQKAPTPHTLARRARQRVSNLHQKLVERT